MSFDEEYEQFLQWHRKKRKGQRLERLKHGHGHVEKQFLQNVWWPAFQHFDDLHPEYEIYDFKDGYRYIDIAYIKSYFKIAIEIDGLGPHWRNITKWKFSDHCQRQNHLVIDSWHVSRFAYDDIKEQPRLCQQTLHQLMGKLLGKSGSDIHSLHVIDREIILLSLRSPRVTPGQVSNLLGVSRDRAARYLRKLAGDTWLKEAGGTIRIRSYCLPPSRRNIQL